MEPAPYGVWGLLDADLRRLPSYGGDGKAAARRLLAAAGFTAAAPLRVEIVTRGLAIYLDAASFVVGELARVGVQATLRQVESAQWFPMLARGEFQIAVNVTGLGLDDPDASFYENYACGSPRNYGGYCSPETMALIDAQSATLDAARRLRLVREIQRRLDGDAARPILAWRLDHFAQWPRVRNLVPHHVEQNWARMQDVWLAPESP